MMMWIESLTWPPLASFHSIYLVFLLTGFTVGFGHCIGMCGPIVVSVSLLPKEKQVFLPHLLYNSGRILTYTLLGGLLGFVGSFTRLAIPIVLIQKTVLIVTGFVVTAMGLGMMGVIPKIRIFSIFTDDARSFGFITKGFKRLSGLQHPYAYFPVGMLLGLLPCGPVYTALVAAARAGMEADTSISGTLTGMGVLFCFGLGTAPVLLLLISRGHCRMMDAVKSEHNYYAFR
jgi:sulfite exporter TauE/SafE